MAFTDAVFSGLRRRQRRCRRRREAEQQRQEVGLSKDSFGEHFFIRENGHLRKTIC